jgi:DNA polymerase-3 subunit epsilon
MRRVAVAITTTGSAPMHGARVDELAAVEVIDDKPDKTVHFGIAIDTSTAPADGRVSFSEAYTALLALIGRDPVIAHDVYDLHRFLRAECKRAGIPHRIKRGHPVTDTLVQAKERFPRQRHDLETIAKKLSVVSTATGVLRSLQLLSGIAHELQSAQSEQPVVLAVVEEAPAPVEGVGPILGSQRSLAARLALCWRVLIGEA